MTRSSRTATLAAMIPGLAAGLAQPLMAANFNPNEAQSHRVPAPGTIRFFDPQPEPPRIQPGAKVSLDPQPKPPSIRMLIMK